jgi:hypothetical protein
MDQALEWSRERDAAKAKIERLMGDNDDLRRDCGRMDERLNAALSRLDGKGLPPAPEDVR